MDVARDHRPGHIGFTPQPVDDWLVHPRLEGIGHDFDEHLEPATRVDAYLPLPPPEQVVPGGYFRDDSLLIQITGAMQRQGLERMAPNPKTFGDPFGGDA